MSTVSASYDAVVLGVSQQVPSKRLSGQHWTQDNFVSDPVRGLRRRPGARRLSQTAIAVATADAADIGTNFRNFDVLADDRAVSLLCRRPYLTGTSRPIFAFQRGAYGAVADAAALAVNITTSARALLDRGINAVTAVGDFFVLAHTYPVGSVRTELYETTDNRRAIVFSVKASTYLRTYTIRMKRTAGAAIEVSYSVPSLYNGDGTLNPSAVEASQPNNVAQELADALALNVDFTGFYTLEQRGSTLLIYASSDVEYAEASDDGDNTQITATWMVVKDAADLPPSAPVTMIVQVSPETQDEVYYLRAEADSADPANVVWREYTSASVYFTNLFCIGRIYNDVLYIGADPADLQASLTAAGSTEVVPAVAAREVGDDDSMPTPHFVGREITELRVFQERLLVCAGPVVNASRVSSFFNFWRTTVLTYPDDDAVEMYATGSESDTIRSSVIFDRSVVFAGDQQQYAISGKVPLTGSTATIMQSSAHRDASAVRPVSLGELLFFLKAGRAYVSAYQIAVGSVDDTSNSSEISRQLHDYLAGQGIELLGLSMPSMLLIRTTTTNTLYTWAYMDNGEQRVFDAWSRWTFDTGCGTLSGLGNYKDAPRLFFAKANGPNTLLSILEVDLNDTRDVAPHLDSWYFNGEFPVQAGEHCAFTGDAGESQRWFGREDNNVAALHAEFGASSETVLGYAQPAVVRLTSPKMLDAKGKPLAGGSLVVGAVTLDLADSGAVLATTELPWGEQPGLNWSGRILGQPNNLVGRRQLVNDSPSIFIGQDADNYVLRIEAVDWRPLTITGIEWKGQYFKRPRSV